MNQESVYLRKKAYTRNTITFFVYALGLSSTAVFVYRMHIGVHQTAAATWIIALFATLLLAIVTMGNKRKLSVTADAILITALFGQVIALIFMFITGSTTDPDFVHYVVGLGVIVGFMIFLINKDNRLLSSVAINVTVAAGFIPLWWDLAQGSANESVVAWSLVIVSSVLSFYGPLTETKVDWTRVMFPVRSIITSATTVALSI